ncbi:MAG: glutathione S-transferase N-terminal domain-containing protein [Pseudonocardiaceae bacterium]
MKLYICWGTFQIPGPRPHPCHDVHAALKAAGHDPELVRTYRSGALPPLTPGRKEVKRLTGQSWVPLLVTDDGELIRDSKRIIEWAEQHPASAP